MAFDDGTPLDAAKLQALETELNNVKASIPKIGSSTVKIDASTSVTENKTIVQAQIAGNITTEAKTIPAKGYANVTISLGLTSDPLAVVVTPIKKSGSIRDMTWTILGTPTSNEVVVRVWNGYSQSQSVRFSWIAVCGNR